MGLLKIALATVLVVVLAFAALIAWGAWKWRGLTQSLVDRLEAGRVAPSPARFDARELEGLPPVVQRYFRATMPDGELSLTLTLTFDAQGLMESVRADARGRTEGGKIVMRPWEGRWSNHQLREGMRVPLSGEVAWLLPPEEGGRKPYWRGTIRSLSYEWAPY
ncbi:hypothetical protein KIH07_10780 [Hydrogenophaga taeniospiralis]|uniref:DUF6920 family protein n=1 Tax=Hydrogenophaga taeniospiralis TaxID=65656 RepID=UPI001CFB89C3|nr:DUF6544 family protein [Hydrogenophaga taeniospiralis]MCB4364221.1 hypothetical protein [Hydrogenophaga taeniospiralis]